MVDGHRVALLSSIAGFANDISKIKQELHYRCLENMSGFNAESPNSMKCSPTSPASAYSSIPSFLLELQTSTLTPASVCIQCSPIFLGAQAHHSLCLGYITDASSRAEGPPLCPPRQPQAARSPLRMLEAKIG